MKPVPGGSIQEQEHSITYCKIITAIQKNSGKLHTA